MPNIVVITFDNMEEATRVREAIRSAEKHDYMSLDDSAVVIRDEEGKVHVHNELDRGVKVGAVAGGLLGLLVGVIFAPLAGVILGVVGGGLVGASADLGVNKKFIKEVTDALQPGTSAIFIIVRKGNPNMAIAALKPYKGTVYSTTLEGEDEETLRRVLSKREGGSH